MMGLGAVAGLGLVSSLIRNPQSAALSELAPAINGDFDRKSKEISGTYAGRDVRVGCHRLNVGSGTPGNGNPRIGVIYIQANDVPGQHDWTLAFDTQGWRIFSPYTLQFRARDAGLLRRLEASGVVEAVAAVNQPPKWAYAPVKYDARSRQLEYVCILPRRRHTPSGLEFATQLELVARLASINEQVNAEAPE